MGCQGYKNVLQQINKSTMKTIKLENLKCIVVAQQDGSLTHKWYEANIGGTLWIPGRAYVILKGKPATFFETQEKAVSEYPDLISYTETQFQVEVIPYIEVKPSEQEEKDNLAASVLSQQDLDKIVVDELGKDHETAVVEGREYHYKSWDKTNDDIGKLVDQLKEMPTDNAPPPVKIKLTKAYAIQLLAKQFNVEQHELIIEDR